MSSQIEYVESPFWAAYDHPVVKDESTSSYEYIRLTPDTPVDNPQLILRNQDKANWYLPSESYLEIKLTVNNAANTPIPAGSDISLINNLWHLFTDARLRINSQEIEFKRLVGEATTILNALNYSEDYSQSVASNGFWYPDFGTIGTDANATAAHNQIGTAAGADATPFNPNYNQGHVSRSRFSKFLDGSGKHQLTVMLKLSECFGFLRDVKVPLVGVQYEFEFNRNRNMNQLLFGSTAINAAAGITFNRVQLWMPRVRPTATTEERILSKFNGGGSHSINWREFKCHDSNPQNATQLVFDIPSMTSKPAMVYVAFKLDTASSSSLINYGVYPNLGLTQIYVEINGKRYPEQPIDCKYAENDYTRAYMSMLAASNKCTSDNCDLGSVVSYQNFKDNYAIYCIDVSKTDPSIYDNVNINQIRLNATFDTAVSRKAYCVVEADRVGNIIGSNGQLAITI